MKPAAFVFAAALGAFAARADVIPPPEPITDVQQAMAGAWQQQGPSGRMGHGEGVETLAFDKERVASIYMFALPPSAMYQVASKRGTWTGERISDTEINVSILWEGATTAEERIFKFSGETEMQTSVAGRGGLAVLAFKRVYP
ncbi:MAG: hypothetical protein QM698_10635 [Micropepsaceae bacterium]